LIKKDKVATQMKLQHSGHTIQETGEKNKRLQRNAGKADVEKKMSSCVPIQERGKQTEPRTTLLESFSRTLWGGYD